MADIEARVALQRTRFDLIQAASFEYEDNSSSTRQLTQSRLGMLEQNWAKFQQEHENLCLFESAIKGHHYGKERLYERCQAFYVYARAQLHVQRDEWNSDSLNTRSIPSVRGASSMMMLRSFLPRIKLPIFSGDYQTWRSFHDLFSSLIRENDELSNLEKMHYLKTCVTGEAARVVGNLPVSDENFSIAWTLLIQRYENKRFLINSQLDRISDLKPLKTKSAKGLRTLLTTISEAIAALRAMGCAVYHWDPLLLHQLVRLLNLDIREAGKFT